MIYANTFMQGRQPTGQPGRLRQRPRGSCCLTTMLIIGSIVALVLVVAAFVVVIFPNRVSTTISTAVAEPQAGVAATSAPPVNVDDAAAVGDTVALENLRITVTDVRNPAEIPDLRPPLPNNQFWSIAVTVENSSADLPIAVDSTNAQLQDKWGNVYGSYLQALIDREDAPLRASLQPGAAVSDIITYEVPLGLDELFWVYREALSGEYAVVQIR